MKKEKKSLGMRIAASALAIATAFVLIPFGGKEAKAGSESNTAKEIDTVVVNVTAPTAGETATLDKNEWKWTPVIATVDSSTYNSSYFQYNKCLPSEDANYELDPEISSIKFVEGDYYYFEIFLKPADGYEFKGDKTTNEFGGIEDFKLTADVTLKGLEKTEWELGYCSPDQIGIYGKVKAASAVTTEAAATTEATITNETPADNAMSANLGNDASELKTLVLTDEDLKAMAAGQDVSIWLSVADIATTVDATEKALVENATKTEAEGYSIGSYLSLNLFKKVGATQSAVAKTNGKIKVSFVLPESLLGDYTYKIVRIHNGVPTVIDATYDAATKTLTFETDEFSTYAIIFKGASAATTTAATTTATTASATEATTTAATTATAAKSNSPKTGDSALPYVAFAILGLAAIGGAVSMKKFAK